MAADGESFAAHKFAGILLGVIGRVCMFDEQGLGGRLHGCWCMFSPFTHPCVWRPSLQAPFKAPSRKSVTRWSSGTTLQPPLPSTHGMLPPTLLWDCACCPLPLCPCCHLLCCMLPLPPCHLLPTAPSSPQLVLRGGQHQLARAPRGGSPFRHAPHLHPGGGLAALHAVCKGTWRAGTLEGVRC